MAGQAGRRRGPRTRPTGRRRTTRGCGRTDPAPPGCRRGPAVDRRGTAPEEVRRRGRPPLGVDPRRRRRSMVAVGDVQGLDLGERSPKLLDPLHRCGPQPVHHTIFGGDLPGGVDRGEDLQQGGEALGGPVGEEHQAHLGVEDLHVMGTIVFLVGTGELVLADRALVVLGHRGRRDDPDLGVLAHHLSVQIVGGCRIFDHDAAAQQGVEVGPGLSVGLVAVGIGPGIEIHLGSGHPHEGVAVGGQAPGVGLGQDIVRGCDHPVRQIVPRS